MLFGKVIWIDEKYAFRLHCNLDLKADMDWLDQPFSHEVLLMMMSEKSCLILTVMVIQIDGR